jgi:5-methylcytosine-specific restriction endonuclease McrA
VSVGEIAKRDGNDCKICGDEVDLNAEPKDPFRGSVDHIVPRSRGGSNHPSNLQLSHLWCNQVKSDRADFTFIPDEAVS